MSASNVDTAQFVVNFAAGTKDFHITAGGKEIKFNNSNRGGTGQYNLRPGRTLPERARLPSMGEATKAATSGMENTG